MPNSRIQALAVMTRDGAVEHVYVITQNEFPSARQQQDIRDFAAQKGFGVEFRVPFSLHPMDANEIAGRITADIGRLEEDEAAESERESELLQEVLS